MRPNPAREGDWVLLEPLRCLPPVQNGKACIHEDEIGTVLPRRPDLILPIHRFQKFIAGVAQQGSEAVSLLISNGYAFRFGPNDLEEIARFVANERKCCPFLAFAIEVSEDGGPVWLRISGPEGSRALLDAEFPIWGSTSRCHRI